jgi:hypothetical protein
MLHWRSVRTLIAPLMASVATASSFYPIGKPGVPWGAEEKAQWLARANKDYQRSYLADVVDRLQPLKQDFDVVRYGHLPYGEDGETNYPLFAVQSRPWKPDQPCVLVTGGVHGCAPLHRPALATWSQSSPCHVVAALTA